MATPGILLLTGSPRIGKTTVIRRVDDQLRERRLGGFYTEEIREGGQRRGFRLVGFDGTEKMIADVGFSKEHCVGKYGVDVRAIDEAVSLLALDSESELYLVDEIGKMECLSGRFINAMRALLTGPKPVVATIALRGRGFIEEVKTAEGVTNWEVTHTNRDNLPTDVLLWLNDVAQAQDARN